MKRLRVAFFLCWLGSAACVSAEVIGTFSGEADLVHRDIRLDFHSLKGGTVSVDASKTDEANIDFVIEAHQWDLEFFEVTTRLKGSAQIVRNEATAEPFIKGLIMAQEPEGHSMPSGSFEIRGDRFVLTDLSFGGVKAGGQAGLVMPYDIDLSLTLDEVPLRDFLAWLGCPADLYVRGNVSGELGITGFGDRISIGGTLASYGGQVNDFTYDNIVAGLEGTYPVLRLVNTTVTEEDGISAQVSGTLDLSQDFAKFQTQLSKLQTEPLVKDDDLYRRWVLRRNSGDQGRETEFNYRLRRPQEALRDRDEGMISIGQSIKF